MRFFLKAVLLLLVIFSHARSVNYREMGYRYLYPAPGYQYVSKYSSILLRFENAPPALMTNLDRFIVVRGSGSGRIPGQIVLSRDRKTIRFKPDGTFTPGETVHVTMRPVWKSGVGREIPALDYRFRVAAKESGQLPAIKKNMPQSPDVLTVPAKSRAKILANGVSVPSDFPDLEITVNKNPDPGYIFLNHNTGTSPFNLILDNDGSPVWYRRMPYNRRDFKVQKDGTISMVGGGFTGFDQNFNQLKNYYAVEGYNTDDHGLQVLENGDYFLIGFRDITVDMSDVVSGGKRNAHVHETCIQGFSADGELTFIWPALENFHPEELIGFTVPGDEPTNNSFRFTHMNAIDIDDDGHILLSSRHLSQATKINRETGEIIWRLGGALNDFTFINDPLQGPRNQHDIRNLGNGHYSVFDNGNTHSPSRSRGVEWKLDTEKMTATLVWEYRNPPGTEFSHYMGNCQRLPNGNTLINWALWNRPRISEISPTGEVEFEMWSRDHYDCYRVFRFPWSGMEEEPYLLLESDVNSIVLLFNKFGDPDVGFYRIYGGTSPGSTTVWDTCRTTMRKITNLEKNKMYYFRVTAVYADGSESGFSNEEKSKIIDLEPNVNFIINGDFGEKLDNWVWDVRGAASADWRANDDLMHFDIQNGGNSVWEIQIRQNGMPLVKGQEYLFEFDAWADASRTIEAKVGQDTNPYTNYSRIGLSYLTTRKKHYSYEFEMQEPSDFDGRVVINVGTSNHDVYIDNLSLKLIGETNVEFSGVQNPGEFQLMNNYPNPFNNQTTIAFKVPEPAHVTVDLYNLAGQKVARIMDNKLGAGPHSMSVDAGRFASGIYFYKMYAETQASGRQFSEVKKMVMVK